MYCQHFRIPFDHFHRFLLRGLHMRPDEPLRRVYGSDCRGFRVLQLGTAMHPNVDSPGGMFGCLSAALKAFVVEGRKG
jgi:hypothetical protein